ncbi:MAG TPA: hypothetical protein VFK37_06280 [Bacillales bacterium]|nr:hypothetical protein [Bacillales bacterium]
MFREYKPFHLSPYDHPDIYPGPRPASSFIFYKGQAHRIEEQAGKVIEDCMVHIARQEGLLGTLAFSSEQMETVNAFLHSNNEASVEDRIPLLGYGSNVCLAQLAYKYALNPELSDTIICLRASMKDSDIVYGSFLAPYGSLPAIIAPVEGAETEIWLTLVDKEQFDHMTSTEGGYGLREHSGGKCMLRTGERFEKVYGYYNPSALLVDGEMRRFKDIPGRSPLKAEWEADLLNWLKDAIAFDGTRERFLHQLRWDHAFHKKVNEILHREHELFFEHSDLLKTEQFQLIKEMKRWV